jgi:hypothetical protein
MPRWAGHSAANAIAPPRAVRRQNGEHADFPVHRTQKGAAEGPLRPRHNEHQTREESLFELQEATLPVMGKLA